MEFFIHLKDLILEPGKRLDPSRTAEKEIIALIRKAYGFLAETMEVSIQEGMVRIQFKDATPEKIDEALKKLQRAVDEAQSRRLLKALKLIKEVLAVIPEHVDARRNMAKVYLELGNLDQAKKHLLECVQIKPGDTWSYIMLGNIYTKHTRDLDVAEFYYEKGMECDSNDGMLLNNYANLMMEKGDLPKAEELFKMSLRLHPSFPHTYLGLALLYRVSGYLKESLEVLERLWALKPQVKGIETSTVYEEAESLYREVKKQLRTDGTFH